MALGDADDNVVSINSIRIVAPDSIQNVPAFASPTSPERVTQQKIQPVAVTGRLINVINSFDANTFGPFLVPTGASLYSITTSTNNQQQPIINFVARQFFIGSLTSLGQTPQVISSSNYPVYEGYDLYDDDSVFIGNMPWISRYRIQLRNNSGSSQLVWVQTAVKVIANGATGSSRPSSS